MAGVFFAETLRRDWRLAVYWGAGLALLGFVIISVIPDAAALNRYADMLESMPPFMLNMLGAEDATALTTPEGFIGFGFFGYALLVLAVFGVLAGLSITSGEEDGGVLDVVLSLPVPRWRVFAERFAAYAVLVVLIAFIGFVGLVLANATTSISIDNGRLLVGALNMIPATLLVIAFTAFVAVVLRPRSVAVGLAAGFIVVSFFLDFIASAARHVVTDALSLLSFFTYYDGQHVMLNGPVLVNVLVLLAAMGLLLAGGLWFFERRDIGL